MKTLVRALAPLSAAAVLMIACSSNTIVHVSGDEAGAGDDGGSGDDGSGGGGSGDDGGGGGGGGGDATKCQLPTGTYATHYTSATGTTTCPKPPDSSFDLTASDGGAFDAGPACNVTTDTATCTTTTECTYETSGYTTHSKTVLVNHGNGTATGSQSTKTTKDADGSVLSDCTYEFTWTKE